ncbi:MAG: methylenetetrahydrofolate reductase [NAD(P)H] [Gammaproteobacteria bacterium]|nr:methylenetetrahydrofolate reductase [NAD(P)H] [Gammaproteobacteria bacterium]
MKGRSLEFSYEFFPPRSQAMDRRLWRAVGQLERLNPAFFSVTYGALGSVQNVSVETAIAMQSESPVPVAAHLTCVDASRQQVDAVARDFHHAGFDHIVALRGDSSPNGQLTDGYQNAAELVEGLLKIADFDISVAAYPEVHPLAQSASQDLQNLKYKLDIGASRAITQYFFDADCFLRFRDRACKIGIDKPIIPGILPVHDIDKVSAFSQRCGASLPDLYISQFDKVKHDPQAQYQLSVDLAVAMCEQLAAEGVDQFHLYTLNQTDLCLDISLALGATTQPVKVGKAA